VAASFMPVAPGWTGLNRDRAPLVMARMPAQ
jgi:hypothetical protein